MFRCFFGQKEKVNPDSNIDEITKNNPVLSSGAKEDKRKEKEFIESESRRVRNQILDYIKYPQKYTEYKMRVDYAGGFDVDFDPLINIVNKCPGIRLENEYKPSHKEGTRSYLIIRHVFPDEVYYIIC